MGPPLPVGPPNDGICRVGTLPAQLPHRTHRTGTLHTVPGALIVARENVQREREIVQITIDRADVTYLNLIAWKEQLGYAGRDYLYYKKRCGENVASLQLIDYSKDAESMIENNVADRKIRLLLTRDAETEQQVSITPIKRPREQSRNLAEHCTDEPIYAYKLWLAKLLRDQQTDLRDDFREETTKTYT